MEYYFHEEVAPRYTPGVDYFLVGGTHPKVFVGGFNDVGGYSGDGTHGSYPFSGEWPDSNVINTHEYVDGLGLHIDFANYQNIVILPEIGSIAEGHPLEWLLYGAYWGHPLSSPSAADGLSGTVYSITNGIFPHIPFGQPWFAIIGFAIWDAYVMEGIELIDDTRLAPVGPALKKNTYKKVYNQTGLNIYTKR